MSKIIKLFTVASLLIFTVSCKEEQKAATSSHEIALPAIKLQAKDVSLVFDYPARAKGYKETEVRARVGGILLERNYIEGSKVEEGDVLFQIDSESYEAALDQARGKLADIEAQLIASKAQWKRIDKLFQDGIVSEKSRDDAKANLDSLTATLEAVKAEVKTAELNLEYTTVRAPISGTTSMESQSEGSLIVANSASTLLTSITQLDPIYIMFSVSDSEFFRIKLMAQKKQIDDINAEHAHAKIKFSDNSTYDHEGKINFIDSTIDENTGTVTLRAEFPNPDSLILPQQFVRLSIEGLVKSNAITIPKEVVMQGTLGSFVYIIDEQGEAKITPVETSLTAQNGDWIVSKGLVDGDIVIAGGLQKVKEGMLIKPVFANSDSSATNN